MLFTNLSSIEDYPREYFYSSTVTTLTHLFMSIILGILIITLPFYFYILLTQSKTLSIFKWFLINHTVWNVSFTMTFAITKPVLLWPAASGYFNGFVNSSDDIRTDVFIICWIFIVTVLSIAGNCMSLAYRYVTIFKEKVGFFISTTALKIYILIQVLFVFVAVLFCYFLSFTPKIEMLLRSLKYNGLRNISAHQPSFFLFERDFIKIIFGICMGEFSSSF